MLTDRLRSQLQSQKEGHVCHFSVLNISKFSNMDCSIGACRGLFEVDSVSIFLSAQLFLSLSKIHSKNTSPMGVISSVPRMASDIFLHPPCSADRPFGVKNTQSLCITFLNFFASLLYAFPDLMTALSKPGALMPWPPDVEILLRACPRTSLKWQCVYKTITCLESSAFVFHFSNWGLQLGCCQCTFWISQKLGRWVVTF